MLNQFSTNETGRCHPQYLSEGAHRKFSQSRAFDGLRIHTDELQEVIARFLPGSLSHAIVSDLPANKYKSGSLSTEVALGHGQHGLV
jgi:hypothetical protein